MFGISLVCVGVFQIVVLQLDFGASSKRIISTEIETAILHLEGRYRSSLNGIPEAFYEEVLAIYKAKNDLFEKLDIAESSSLSVTIQHHTKRIRGNTEENHGHGRKHFKSD